MVCTDCWLAQTTETVPEDQIFDHDYAYLSSYSAGWVAHARRYAEMMAMRFGLGPQSRVVEVASNDGYLLQHFVAMGVPVLGVEPAGHAAEIARGRGIDTRVAFFGAATAAALKAEGIVADLMSANNVLAHVPDIRDFAMGFKTLLAPGGVATFEFPHLANLIEFTQFDTIYHEHYSYLSLTFVETLMAAVGLEVFDVETLPTHGGSLRVFVGHRGAHPAGAQLEPVRAREQAMQLGNPAGYAGLGAKVAEVTGALRVFLDDAKAAGHLVAAYGAAAKGNTFLNVAGIGPDLVAFVVDRNPEKQNRLLPGSHIPVFDVAELARRKPDYVLILPWNLSDEIRREQAGIVAWGGRFVQALPHLTVT